MRRTCSKGVGMKLDFSTSPRRFHRIASVVLSSLLGMVMAIVVLTGLETLTRQPVVSAASITVNTVTDELNTDGDCSLREALQAANTDTAVDACLAGSGADIINIPVGIYTLTLAGAGEDANTTGDLDITSTVTLNGVDIATTIIDANRLDRALHVTQPNATITLFNLTVRNGQAANAGGLQTPGPAVISNTIFNNNIGGGAEFATTAFVTNSVFSSNTACCSGGGAFFGGFASVTGATFSNNVAASGSGAFFQGVAHLTGTAFIGNVTNNVPANFGGGAYFLDSASVRESRFIGNSAYSGGGISFSGVGVTTGQFVNVLFANNSSVTNRGAALYIFNADGDDVVTLRHITIVSSTLNGEVAIYVANGTVNITNTIVATFTDGLRRVGGAVNENYNLYSGVTTPYSGTVISGGNSITGTVAFVDSTDYRLSWGSAARNAGTDAAVTTDFEGDLRPFGTGFDMGWDEAVWFPVFLPLIAR